MENKGDNIILIGMPGCGKSTVGVVLAKMLCKDFVDMDLMIQRQQGMGLQGLIDRLGIEGFLALEADTAAALDCRGAVVATGGSAVLTQRGARALAAKGTMVYIQLPYIEVARRLGDLSARGVTIAPGQSLEELYNQRLPHYRQWADVTINASGLGIEGVCRKIISALGPEE